MQESATFKYRPYKSLQQAHASVNDATLQIEFILESDSLIAFGPVYFRGRQAAQVTKGEQLKNEMEKAKHKLLAMIETRNKIVAAYKKKYLPGHKAKQSMEICSNDHSKD